jgi:Tol biopolymer transport system component
LAKPGAFTLLDPPRPAGAVRNGIWAPDGTGFYVAAGKGNIYELSESYGIWRYDLASGKPTQVSDANVVAYSYIDGISSDGAMLLLRNPQGGAMLVNTVDGYATPIELAAEARVAGWRARAQ